MQVYVRSVLPADTALRKPKPLRPVVAVSSFNWKPWLLAAIIAALLGLAIYLWRRLRERARQPLTPGAWAEREFARIESQRMLESGETERYAIAMSDVLRGYLARAVPRAHASLTTSELREVLSATPEVPRDSVTALLSRVDLLKFAAVRVTQDEASAIAGEARRLVAESERAFAASRSAERVKEKAA